MDYIIYCRSLYRTVDSDWWTEDNTCGRSKTLYGMNHGQVEVCGAAPTLMKYVSNAAYRAVFTCQQIFLKSRWNCSSVFNAPSHTPDLISGE